MGIWSDIKPLNCRRKKHAWLFAVYSELPTERDDGQWYRVLVFRNEERTVFGMKEEIGDDLLAFGDSRALARRILDDREFRESLVSRDPRLPRMWKRH